MSGFFLFFLNRYAIIPLPDCLNIPFLRMVILSVKQKIYTNRKNSLPLSDLQTIFIRSCAYHLFEYSAQMMRILETEFVGNFTDSLVLFR